MITKYTEYIKENLSSKQDIKSWLEKMNITNYIINTDLTVDVNGDVNISRLNLTEILVKFNKINGYFYCYDNNLTSLKCCPNIVKYEFCCDNNNLTSLKYCPYIVNGDFNCHKNLNLVDINDLNSKILIKNINRLDVKQEVFDKYFEYWITKDINIFNVLKNKISDKIKTKYNHLFNANNFDLI